MNRIVIIGNGFDKAHNLPTGYTDFTDFLSTSIAHYVKNPNGSYSIISNGEKCGEGRNLYHRLMEDGNKDPWICVQQIDQSFDLEVNPHAEPKSIYFKSLFDSYKNNKSWANLESHYFELLYSNRDNREKIKTINLEFEHLKKLLKDYLKTEIEDKTGDDKEYGIDTTSEIYQMLKFGHNNQEFEKTYFINFNYTSKILNQYVMWLQTAVREDKFPQLPIHIHGDLVNPTNPIIFGYGDENSSHYKDLELALNNELLINFKTFQYLRSNIYSEILGLLEETENIYIQMIGHSCGLCDKALLRTIFQNKNVKKIESTYYKDESKFFENLYNISRIFDDNTLMRRKLIPLHDTFMI